MRRYFLTGTYSEPILFGTGEVFTGKGKGIYLCALEEDGRVTILDCLPLGNPSFLAVDEKRGHIYAVNEMKEFHGAYGGGLTDILFDEKGRMSVLSSYGTGGTDPCHVAVSPDGTFLAVANYADGTISVFALDETGAVTGERMLFTHQGSGLDSARQAGPHAHCILFDHDGGLWVNDLGIDRIKAYGLKDHQLSALEELDVCLRPGSGPRSGELSADGAHMYVTNELASAVTHLRKEKDTWKVMETVSSLPGDFSGDNICADLHLSPDGRYLYASNRGHDSIAVFRLLEDHSLSISEWVPCGGKTPRNFAIDPDGCRLLVGNQDSDCIAVYDLKDNGHPQMISTSEFPTPVCIRFLKEKPVIR